MVAETEMASGKTVAANSPGRRQRLTYWLSVYSDVMWVVATLAACLLGDHLQQCRQFILEATTVDDKIEESMLEQELTPLEAFGKVLLDRFFDHAWARKTDQGSRLCYVEITKHSEARGNTAERGIC